MEKKPYEVEDTSGKVADDDNDLDSEENFSENFSEEEGEVEVDGSGSQLEVTGHWIPNFKVDA